ncbi:MAG: response regulator transcription factor [Acidimicrobiales bacterium]
MKLLVVEDDESISGPLRTGLTREGFDVEIAATAAEALAAEIPDLVLLDLGLPDLDGRVVCRELRARSSVPIIIVTARGDEIERVTLLEAGADDFMVKPYGFRELVARIRAVLRRVAAAPTPDNEARAIGGLLVDPKSRRVERHGTPVALTPREFDLLVYLTADPGAVFSRDEIIHDVWDENWWGSTKTLDVHVASLRKKIGAQTIETVRGVGFRVVDPDGDE